MSRYDKHFIEVAKTYSKLSYAERKKVGAIIVKDNSIISDGYNGTPTGFSNECEDSDGVTHWYVLHAEANAITKVAKSGCNCKDATLYVTLSPCKDCSKLIIQSGISRVVFSENYSDTTGLEFLLSYGIKCEILNT